MLLYWVVEIPSMCAVISNKSIVYVPHPHLPSVNTISLEKKYLFLDRGSQCGPSCCIDQNGLELEEIPLPLLPKSGIKGVHHHG